MRKIKEFVIGNKKGCSLFIGVVFLITTLLVFMYVPHISIMHFVLPAFTVAFNAIHLCLAIEERRNAIDER